jgi:hypothetical protein
MKAECLEARGRLTPKQIVVAAMRKLLVLQKSLDSDHGILYVAHCLAETGVKPRSPKGRASARRSGPQQRAPPSLRARIRLLEQDRIRNGLSVSAAGLQLLLGRAPWRKPSTVPPLRATARAHRDSRCGKPHAAGLAIREPQTTALRPDRISPVPRRNRRCRLHTAP